MQPNQTVTEPIIKGKYVALITQTSTNAPTATVLQNTLTGTPTYTYIAEGQYQLTLEGEFVSTKTTMLINNSTQAGTRVMNINRQDDDTLEINQVSLTSGVPINGFTRVTIEITTYR